MRSASSFAGARYAMLLRRLPLCLALAGLVAAAQPSTVRFTPYGVDDGLPSADVLSVAQDSVGFVWFGTKDGVARFDGVRFHVWRHRPGRADGLPSNIVNVVHVDSAGTVWAGTVRGVARLDATTGRFVRVAEDALARVGAQAVYGLASDGSGLWVSGPNGVFRVSPQGNVRKAISGVSRTPDVLSVGGAVWFRERACRLSPTTGRCERPRLPEGVRPLALWEADGATLALTDGQPGVWEVWPRVRQLRALAPFPILPSNRLGQSRPSTVAVPLQDGLFLYRPSWEAPVQIGVAEGLPGRDVRGAIVDRQGGVWAATDRGVGRWAPPIAAFRAVTGADGLPDDRVNGLATTPDGSLWIATNGGLVHRQPGGAFRLVPRLPSDASPYRRGVWRVARAAGGGLWLGGKASGLQRYWPETGRVVTVEAPARLLDAEEYLGVRDVVDEGGRVWVATSVGLALRDGGGWRAFPIGPGGPPGAANAVLPDGEGGAWVGTDGGLVRFRSGRIEPVAGPAGTALVWDLVTTPVDPDALWLGTVGSGACRLDRASGRTRCLTTADGLPSNVVHRIETGAGALWLGTDRGVVRLDPTTYETAVFTAADGLHGDVVDLMSSHRTPSGMIYMGGPGGYTAFDPRTVSAPDRRPPVVLSAVEAGDRPADRFVASGDTVRLERGARRLAVAFAALDYRRPERNRYRYRLAPLEAEWTETDGAAAEARYAALPAGAYTFEVVGSTSAGVFSSEPARLRVEVPPAWWERRAVQALGAALALALVGAAGWRAVRRSERRQAEAAEVSRRLAASREGERLRLAREIHDGAVQHLYRVGHDLDRLATAVAPPERDGVAAARSGLDEASADLRAVLADLRPPHVGTLGAAAAVREAARRFGDAQPQTEVDLDLEATGRRWPVPIQHAAVRIVQEALSNAAKHADASAVRVRLAEADGGALVEVADDGRGFDAAVADLALVRDEHFGLVGLRERAESLGGRLAVTSAPGAGTTVRAWLPL